MTGSKTATVPPAKAAKGKKTNKSEGPSLKGVFLIRKRLAALERDVVTAKEDLKALKAERKSALLSLYAVLDEMRSGQGKLDL